MVKLDTIYVGGDFLDVVLQDKGFGSPWRRWVGGCVSNANYSIIVNGRPDEKTIPSQDI